MIRFEKKTWFARSLREIERIGSNVFLREGRAKKKAGSPWDPIEEAKTTEHPFPHVHAARRFVLETMSRWKAEGYEEAPRTSHQPSSAPSEPYIAKCNPVLEAEILREGTGSAAIHVLADWLMDEGDPRGALIQEMIRADEEGDLAKKQICEEQALALLWREPMRDRPNVMGSDIREKLKEAHDGGRLSVSWRAGFVDTCWIEGSQADIRTQDHSFDLEFMIGHLFENHSFSLLRKLVIVPSGPLVAHDTLLGILFGISDEALNAAQENRLPILSFPTSLRCLAVEMENDYGEGAIDVERCYSRLPNLMELTLSGMEGVQLGRAIALPKLQALSLEPRILTGANIQSLVSSALPNLERLRLCFFDAQEWEESDFTVRDLVPLFETKSLPSLKYLELRGTMPSDDYFDVLEALLASPILHHLSTLSLQSYFFHTVEMANACLDLVIRNRDKLAHLDVLDLSKDATWAQWFPENASDPKVAKRAAELRSLATKVLL